MTSQEPRSNPAAKRDVRDQMVDALRRELMGPWHPEDETDPSEEFPTARYIVGSLAPQVLGFIPSSEHYCYRWGLCGQLPATN